MSNFVVVPDSSSLNFCDSMYIDLNYSKGLKYSFEFISSIEKINSFISENNNLEVINLSTGLNFVNHIYHEDYSIYVFGNIKELNLTVFAKTSKTLQFLYNHLSTKNANTNIKVYVETYTLVNGKVVNSAKILEHENVTYLNKLYYPYIDTDMLFEEFFKSRENILLLTGEPGLGKSKLAALSIKYGLENPLKVPYPVTMEDPYINLVYIRGVDILGSEEFWIKMEEDTPDLVIIDDLGNMLTTREAEVQNSEDILKNKFMNLFLSFTDGVERNNTKFIITTNQNYKDIDKAILREGRLFDILEMRELTLKEAEDIWVSEGLPKEDFPGLKTAAQLGSEIHKYINKNSNRSYLLESNISKTNIAKQKRSISI